jgi:CheY-like chemotaxis protein
MECLSEILTTPKYPIFLQEVGSLQCCFLSFEIFDQVLIQCPVIFTTAFDENALMAFKVNSIDYLLKPIVPDELSRAMDKFRPLHLDGSKAATLLTSPIAG